MKKRLKRFISVILLLTMLSGIALAAAEPYIDENGVLVVPESYYTDSGIFIPAGYYFPDGSYLPITEDPSTLEDPEDTEDPGQGDTPPASDDPAAGDEPEPGDDPAVGDDPAADEDPAVSDDPDQPADQEPAEQIIRVGLHYGSGAMDGANLGNSSGASGFYFGYYDSNNEFVSVAYTGRTTISIVKTENVYYGSYNNYTTYYDHLTGSSVGVGCYHLQLSGRYTAYEDALAIAKQYDGGFVAYISGVYYVRIGNYLNRDAAVAAQSNLAASGVSTELKGTSSYGISVVATGTNTIVFQYDDEGSGTGLGVEPIPVSSDQKCVSVFASVKYFGGFRYERIKGGDLTIVNMVDMEDYVNCVISQEMSNSWPLEALKAQAVAARSYAMTLKRHSAHHFDVCPTTCCQAYPGTGKIGTNTTQAAAETAGVYVWYGESIAQTFYYSSNGGASENVSIVWGSNQANYPYLVGVIDPYEATIESMISGYSWTRQYTGEELAALMKNKGYTSCSTVVAVKINEYSDVGNPKSVTIKDSNGREFTLTAYQMYKVFGFRSYRYELVNAEESQLSINGETTVESLSGLYVLDGNGNLVLVSSDAYVINGDGTITAADTSGTVTGDVFTFAGKGWGHNIGMSQYGAYAMAKLGYTYDQILKFYYTGVTVGV